MSEAERHALPAVLIRVPLTRQATGYTCGVAALQSVLHYFGRSYRQDVLAVALEADPAQGTNYKRMIAFAQANGITCEAHEGMSIAMLRAMVDAGKPVVIALQAWGDSGVDYASGWDDGHYVVVVGYDDELFFFMDPSVLGNYSFLSVEALLDRWHDCYLENGRMVRLHRFGISCSAPVVAYDPAVTVPMG